MPKLFQSFFVSVVFLTLALFASSVAQAQSNISWGSGAWDTSVAPYTSTESDQYPKYITIPATEAQTWGQEGLNKMLAANKIKRNADGSYTVVAETPEAEAGIVEFRDRQKQNAEARKQNPALEGQGIVIDDSGIKTATSTPQNQAQEIPADKTPQNQTPDISGDFDNMVAAEMAGLDVEIAKINDELSGGNATGSGLTGVCANAGNIFKQIACKVMIFLVDLRVLAYIISGFGMVMFAWAAIFNKISWKHFSQIAIGLFMLSMIGPFITYFTGYTDIEKNLEYGNYLGGSYTPIQGAAAAQCADGSSNCTPDTKTKTVNTKWSLKDLKGSIQAGLNLVRSGYNAYQGAKQVVQNVKTEAKNIGNAIKNSGGGLDGILDAASQVAGAANRLSFDVKTGVGGIASQVSNAANAAQDIAATNDQREERQNIRVNGTETGVKTTNAVSEWLSASGAGGQALGKLNSVSNTVSTAATGVGKATTAGHEGQKIGGNGGFGEVVGGIFAYGSWRRHWYL